MYTGMEWETHVVVTVRGTVTPCEERVRGPGQPQLSSNETPSLPDLATHIEDRVGRHYSLHSGSSLSIACFKSQRSPLQGVEESHCSKKFAHRCENVGDGLNFGPALCSDL